MSEQRFSINSRQLMHETIDGETIMINVTTGNYYSLDPVGSDIWRGIELNASIDEIVDFLVRRYDASRNDVQDAVGKLLAQLEEEELVVRVEANNGPVDLASMADPRPAVMPFRGPNLEKHTDMQDLILLDPVHEVDPERGWPNVKDRSTA